MVAIMVEKFYCGISNINGNFAEALVVLAVCRRFTELRTVSAHFSSKHLQLAYVITYMYCTIEYIIAHTSTVHSSCVLDVK